MGEDRRQGSATPADLAAERFAAAGAEEELRRRLEREQARSAALARDLETVRSSEAFRIGHALVEGIQARLPRTVRALPSALYGRFGRRSAVAEQGPGARARVCESNAVLFIVWGGAEARLAEYADRVERLRATLVDVRPIFVVDSMGLEPLRSIGHAVEYVVPLAEWREHRPAAEWGTYVLERIAAVHDRYRPRAVVLLDDAAAGSALDQGVLDSILLPKLGTSDDNRLDR